MDKSPAKVRKQQQFSRQSGACSLSLSHNVNNYNYYVVWRRNENRIDSFSF